MPNVVSFVPIQLFISNLRVVLSLTSFGMAGYQFLVNHNNVMDFKLSLVLAVYTTLDMFSVFVEQLELSQSLQGA